LPKTDVIPVNISVEDAFKLIISAGIVMPKEMVDIVKDVPLEDSE
jgi:uncharacterized membrane protein